MDYEFVICFLINATESIAQFFFLPRFLLLLQMNGFEYGCKF